MEDSLQQPIRAVRFPLKLKFTVTLGLLLALTLATFLGLATSLIRQDKAAYVYDAILMRTEQQAASLQARLSSWSALLNLKQTEIAANFPEVLALLQGDEVIYQAKNASSEGITVWKNISSAPWQILEQGDQTLFIMEQQGKRAVINLANWQSKDSPFALSLFSQDGRMLLGSKDEKRLIDKTHWVWEILKQSNQQGVQQVGEDLIIAYAKIPGMNWILTSSISTASAFAVAGYLIDKSLFFGLLILGVAILVGIFAVRPLTSQLEDLGSLTTAVGSGDFSKRITPRSHDEAGALADSFNLMAEKITIFMQEMKEKARLESELKVAQLVQNAFFPPTESTLPGIELKAFSAPASECGGDWWGHVEFKEHTLLIIADATGHGVSAALLTATINACKEGLLALAELDPTLPASPARVMQYLNRTICSSGDKIQMTCFVASWHRSSRSLIYSNASHQPALVLVEPKERAMDKNDIRPLLEANGARLGESRDSIYTENYVELPSDARMVLYTDGLTEAANAEGAPWGQRRFLKALLETQDGNPIPVVEAMQAYHQGTTYEDDVTIVSARFL